MSRYRKQMTVELTEKSNALQTAIKELSRLTDFEAHCSYLIVDILADLSKVVNDTDEENLTIYLQEESHLDIHCQVSALVPRIYNKIRSQIVQKCAELELKLMDMQKRWQDELNISLDKDVQIVALKKMIKDVEISKAQLQMKVFEEKAKMKKNLDWVMDQRKIIYDQEVEKLKAEVAKQQKTIDDMREMQMKRSNIAQLREHKAQTKKELEDMEDALSKEIKTLQMRKIYVHNMQNRLKRPNDAEGNNTQKIVEQGYSNTMAGITALRNDIGKLQDSLRQSNSGR